MCTSITVRSVEGQVYYGRTMDYSAGMFGEDPGTPTSVITIPKGSQIKSQLNSWDSKYAVMGVATTGTVCLFDGINEAGLAGDMQVLMECSYASKDELAKRNLTGLLCEEFVTFVLTNFKSVAEIKEQIHNYALVDQAYELGGQKVHVPLHFTFFDESGAGVVLEPTDHGAFKVYDSTGVMTNSPEYSWHLINVRNYISLDNINRGKPKKLSDKLTLEPVEMGTGYGLTGIPGDYTSPSRYVKSTMVSSFMDPFKKEDGINQLYSAFRTVIIPRGLERNSAEDPLSDFTRYWAGYDISERRVYIQTCRGIGFSTMKLDPNQKEIKYTEIDLSNYSKELV
ncbi:linear amide C-N hydrolase [Xylocopilactobacillus apicola]|uniref:Choloylglycine hydrolase n=1 Tax=Xylocopilactobacillus apicola TaxID=2932184 RepID=A0AAU9CW41_9LACO|nr:linear amide C-N hydrolase [Xylocopilactobacillus apicola]BDR58207.1 choloylglycine hydrolase [Xylocopilactobacillus apicola]